ncbi:hypothetical protein RJ639_022462, partial [Escallonia herrerae]
MESTQQQPHIAILPTPGMGHLIPLTEFAKRLVLHHNFTVTFIIPTDGSPMQPQKDILQTLPKSISSIFLPPVSFSDLPEDRKIETQIALSVTRSLPSLREALKELAESTRLSALVVDLFGSLAFPVAIEFGVSPYVFFPTTAMGLCLMFHLHKLDESFSCEYRDLPEPVILPGCVPVHGSDLVEPLQDKKDEAYKWILSISKLYKLAEGIMVNSFMDLEPGAFKALKEGGWCKPPVYPVGPLIQAGSASGDNGLECLKWLGEQPSGSVLFVSFGSGGTLSHEQLTELALGLEMSGQRQRTVHTGEREKRGMDKSIVTLDKGTTCSSWNYCGERLATGSIDGTLTIFDSVDPASSSFTCTSRSKAHAASIVKVVWVPPEYGDAVACISSDGTLSLWEEVVEETQPLQWKLCKRFEGSSHKVLDIQCGVSLTSLKLVIAYSDGHVKVYELLNPLELKNWQLQAEFQNVIDSVSKYGNASCVSASISWNPQRGGSQQSSFVLGFNSNILQLNSSKVWEFDQDHQRWLPVAELALPGDKGDQVYAVAWAPNIGRPYEVIAVATHKGIAIWYIGLYPDPDGKLSVETAALLSGHGGEVWPFL